MRILCTGGAGFIGSHLVDKLINNGHRVYVLDDLSGGSMDNLNPKARFERVDLRDTDEICELDEYNERETAAYWIKYWKPEVVFHLAANASENLAQFSPMNITSRNYDAFIKVLAPFIKYGGKRFVFTSSIAVYGALQAPFKETDKPEPEDLYGISKLAAEESLKVMSKVHGFEYVIVRPHNVYGPRQNMTDPYRNVMTIWMNLILNNKPYYIYGDGEQRRCFSYIDDVVEALYKCGFDDVAGKTFNIGADKSYTLNELSKTINPKIPPIHLPDRPQEVKEATSDHSEAKKYLHYQDKTSLKDGIAKTWEWCEKQGPQTPIYGEIEIMNDKIPSNWLKHE